MYTTHARVGASQTDTNGQLKLVSALDIMQDCDFFWMESEQEFTNHLIDNGLGMFIMSRQIDILRLPHYGEHVSATTYIYECRGFLGLRNTALYDEAGETCVRTYGVGAFVNHATGLMTRLPKDVSAAVTIDPKIDMPYLDRRIYLPEQDMELLGEIHVRAYDIDVNHHMNNARYLEAVMDGLPQDYPFDRVRIEYKKAAKLGDVLHVGRIMAEDGMCYLQLSDAEHTPYTVFEFSTMKEGE
ncbi:hypothetical protein LJC33_07925 [Eubacteriales bacterium OttesenSCG-928-N13]|nr:hypothetical protein [Eubacteriales bacterium OttesenSCG-928-N13]